MRLNGQQSDTPDSKPIDELWLGYDGLNVSFARISALLVYQPVWDRRIAQHYGSVPSDVQVVVLLTTGEALPCRRQLADVRARLTDWQAQQTQLQHGTLPDNHGKTDPRS